MCAIRDFQYADCSENKFEKSRKQRIENKASKNKPGSIAPATLGRQSEDASRTDVSTDTELFKPDRMRE